MDDRTRDIYLARWLVARGFLDRGVAEAWLQRSRNLAADLQGQGLVNSQILTQFSQEWRQARSSVMPGSQSSGFARLKMASRLPQEGEFFAGFEILDELGRGGMGAVFRARRLKDRQLVALKLMLSGENATEDQRKRFAREIETLKRLSHPGIISVYESGRDGPMDYYAMDIIPDARDIREYAEDRDLSQGARAHLLSSCARILHHAHEHEVIHRDIKPGNMVVDTEGQPWIVDFGLARDLARETRLTQSGAQLGTPSYMAPEQCVDAGKADARTDVYALGVVLYELLTGQRPFGGGSATALMAEILNRIPDRPSSINQTVDKSLEAVCLKALEKKPENRYQTALEFAEDLTRAATGKNVEARKSKLGLIIAATLALLLVVGGGAAFWLKSEKDRTLISAESLDKRAQAAESDLAGTESLLRQPGVVSLEGLHQLIDIPPGKSFKGKRVPRGYRLALGRLARLDGEMALRLGQPARVKSALKDARKFLKNSSLERQLDGLEGLYLASTGADNQKALSLLGRALITEKERGDHLRERARLYALKKDFKKALEDIAKAKEAGFDEKRLRADILLGCKRWSAVISLIEDHEDFSATARDSQAYLEAGMEAVRTKDFKQGLTFIERGLGLKDIPKDIARAFEGQLWAYIKAEVQSKKIDKFANPGYWKGFEALLRIADKHFLEALPKDVPALVSSLSLNMPEVDKEDADQNANRLAGWACRWQPDEEEHWLRYSSRQMTRHCTPELLEGVLGLYEEGLKYLKSTRNRLIFNEQQLHIYTEIRQYERGLKTVPRPTQEECRDHPLTSADILIRRGECYFSLKDWHKALAAFNEAADIGTATELRALHNYRGNTYLQLEKYKEATDCYLQAVERLNPGAAISKWRNYVERVMNSAGACQYREAQSRLLKLLKELNPDSPFPYFTEAWIHLRAGQVKAALPHLIKAQEKSFDKTAKVKLQSFIERLKDSPKPPEDFETFMQTQARTL